jgi:hypothetical protein
MQNRYLIIFSTLCLLCFSTVKAQDTLVGWTFPEGSKNSIANIGNELNKNGMFIEADSINEIPFVTAISFAFNGYFTKSASAVLWDHAKDLKCWKFSCDATGYKNLKIYARVSSDSVNPGPRDFKIMYRMGCCSPIWHDVPATIPFTVSTDWTTGFINGVTMPEDADSMSGFQVRFVCTSDTATDGTILKTTSRSLIDEVYVIGTRITSINERKVDFGIEIFPNPASDIIQIRSLKNITDYRLLDLSGKLIKSDQVNTSSFNLFCSELKQGCYFIDLNFQGNYHFNQKIIIQ